MARGKVLFVRNKEDISIFPNELWSEENLIELIG